jgi:hypothetical protein
MAIRLVLLLALALIAPAASATLYAFRVSNWHEPAIGYIDSSFGRGAGLGALYLGGYRFPLTAYDWWRQGGPLSDGNHCCLIIHPYGPWIVGTMQWKGTRGRIDFLSADWVWWEIKADVEIAIDDQKRRM